jgi:hypothetical protein
VDFAKALAKSVEARPPHYLRGDGHGGMSSGGRRRRRGGRNRRQWPTTVDEDEGVGFAGEAKERKGRRGK